MLVAIGFVANFFQRLNVVALGAYKTFIVRKRINPNIKYIGGGCYWNNLKNIVIGDKSYINGAELITTNNSKIIIGANCLISYDVVLRTDMHIFEDKSKPILEQGVSSQNIKIGNNVWIGHGVYVMPGITIGDNSIIGAKAVVTKDIPSNSIAVGVPARVIKKDDENIFQD